MCQHNRECRCPFCTPDSDEFADHMRNVAGMGVAIVFGLVFLVVYAVVLTLLSADPENAGLLPKAMAWIAGLTTMYLLGGLWR